MAVSIPAGIAQAAAVGLVAAGIGVGVYFVVRAATQTSPPLRFRR